MDCDVESAICDGIAKLCDKYVRVRGDAGIVGVCNAICRCEIMGNASEECQQLRFIELRANGPVF